MENIALLTASSIFLLVAVLHLVRYFLKIEVRVGSFAIPLWMSLLGFILALFLSTWMFILVK